MLCEVRSLGLSGISGYEVRAECDLSAAEISAIVELSIEVIM